MSTVAATKTAASAAAFTSSLTGGAKGLGKEDFLKLLVAQLRYQDPLNPNDPTEFTAQLAQFSSLEQQFATNAHLAKMAAPDANLERVAALGMIGRAVVVEEGGFELGSDPVGLGFKLDQAASNVNLVVQNAAGENVGLVPAGPQGPGTRFLTWDGRGLNGQQLPPGAYTLRVSATIGTDTVSVDPLLKGWVTGVDLGSNGSVLSTSIGAVPMIDVKKVDL